MGKLVVSENITLDGVIEDPTGEEGHPSGGWFALLSGPDKAAFGELFAAEAQNAEALLLGGASYAWFAKRWVDREGAWADRLRDMPKYVVSSRPVQDGWGRTERIGEDEIAGLRDRVAGELVVNGSGRLVESLLARDLVDEVRLLVYPHVAGSGARLFGETTTKKLRLAEAKKLGENLVLMTYLV